MVHNPDASRAIGYMYANLSMGKAIWGIAPLIVCIGVINNWWSAGVLLVIFSAIDAGADILGLLIGLLYLGPTQTVMSSKEATWVSKWSLLKHALMDQWHFTASLVMNAWFILGFYTFYFVNEPITQITLARFIGYHFLYLAITLAKSIIIFFTGLTTIECDECGPYTVKPCVECTPPASVESGEADNDNNAAPDAQVPLSAMPNSGYRHKIAFQPRFNPKQ